MTTRRRNIQRPPPPKCKQCGVEKSIIDRADGLGKNCATYKDQSLAKARKAKAGG